MLLVFKEYFKQRVIQAHFFFFAICLYFSLIHFHNFTDYLFILPALLVFMPFYEWIMHKYVLHRVVRPDSKWFEFMRKLHYVHHEDPSLIHFIFAPLVDGLFVIIKFSLVACLIFWDWNVFFPVASYTYALYLFYEWIHLAHHIPTYKPITGYGRTLKKAHMWHHFKNENYWWGITTNLADLVLKTFPQPNEVKVSSSVKKIWDPDLEN